jgi:hypothetical protein
MQKTRENLKAFLKRLAVFAIIMLAILSLGLMYQDAAPALLNALNDKHQLLEDYSARRL